MVVGANVDKIRDMSQGEHQEKCFSRRKHKKRGRLSQAPLPHIIHILLIQSDSALHNLDSDVDFWIKRQIPSTIVSKSRIKRSFFQTQCKVNTLVFHIQICRIKISVSTPPINFILFLDTKS